jgi:hypothetical protein
MAAAVSLLVMFEPLTEPPRPENPSPVDDPEAQSASGESPGSPYRYRRESPQLSMHFVYDAKPVGSEKVSGLLLT